MGKLFVIDGTDGSGKETQFKKLMKRLDDENIEYRTVSFPNYDSPSSSLVKMYLSGEFGQDAKKVSPYVASTFFAVDRFATYTKELEEYYENGGIILADRYTTANMVHQAGKIADENERNKFLDWLWDLEFEKFGIPVPAKVFFLNMPPEYAFRLMENRENKFTHTMEKDIHERDRGHIIDAYNAACGLAVRYNWHEVRCVRNDELRTKDDIHEEIYGEIYKEIYDGVEGKSFDDVRSKLDIAVSTIKKISRTNEEMDYER